MSAITLYKRQGSPFWYFEARVEVRRLQGSTRRRIKREARDEARARVPQLRQR
jgi:hypothetical protein